MKENKFMVGEEEENISKKNTPVRSTTPAQSKRPVRHHIKRRSSGKVHVTKLAPMARAHHASHTDSEADFVQDTQRPAMRRSQSQRSLNKMDRKTFTSTLTKRNPSTDKLAMSSSTPQLCSSEKKPSIAPLTCTAIAEPVQQTFNALANNLSFPKKAQIYPKLISTPSLPKEEIKLEKKQLLRSQFIHEDPQVKTQQQPNMSRTQQKLMLQKQQCSAQDENSPLHPKNVQKLNKELDTIKRQYRCIKRYEDPLRASLMRCIEKLEPRNRQKLEQLPTSSSVPSLSTIPHLEQRQIAHRYHLLKEVALSHQSQQNLQSAYPPQIQLSSEEHQETSRFPWNAAAFLDKLFNLPAQSSSSPSS
ncbi:hypothetical protein CU098_001532 [Rhizopus stolonifer]|uniref:Uncharacterized protein n=1 Tax=Rhizopus stolonifer TaxID=4846 RepID=A0A367KI07_RHIST|nr:hypothetical protein CU098_001532 [Rhizopus stolonifer]